MWENAGRVGPGPGPGDGHWHWRSCVSQGAGRGNWPGTGTRFGGSGRERKGGIIASDLREGGASQPELQGASMQDRTPPAHAHLHTLKWVALAWPAQHQHGGDKRAKDGLQRGRAEARPIAITIADPADPPARTTFPFPADPFPVRTGRNTANTEGGARAPWFWRRREAGGTR
ncbi:hypothetical protein CALVIDRAFT_340711 [Calocera viscosa TUFC12733]|uniref:Uncharacterized protein n=1 Tax=Calocera viscosa (strain TUFC12733) TaxID=1330018 RepID=A0A167HHZ6_CALVF|nr:hypothetical protein CALVIDRAFT_340711 [Calocera viscosa TUFC12733]